jgi:hypothetical protein
VTVGEADELYEKWLSLLRTISGETTQLFLFRDYWRGLVEISEANPDLPPSSFFDALGHWYGTTQAIAVRRQLDKDTRSVSFWRLLTDMAGHPEVMTRERHVALWHVENERDGAREAAAQLANENYDKFAGAGEDTIASERTLEDRERLEAIAKPVTGHVNKVVAHTDEKQLAEVVRVTYADLNQAVDELGWLLQKYVSLIEATMLPQVSPTIQEDWKAPFRVPWITDEG